MVDMTMISGTMSALKAAGEITKLIIASHDANVIRQKAIELQAQIFTAQQNALTAQSDQFTLLERVRELEKQIADLEAWATEKRRYVLQDLEPGVFVYALKPEMADGEPMHQICQTCYQRGKSRSCTLTNSAMASGILRAMNAGPNFESDTLRRPAPRLSVGRDDYSPWGRG
jgi:hypothetical protein